MESQQNAPRKSDRKKRYLNIVYFVESARSHTIRIDLTHARWAIGGLAVVVSWSLGAAGWLWSLNSQLAATRTRLETALNTVFDYQIKNDNVFEMAYPTDSTRTYYAEPTATAATTPSKDTAPSVADAGRTQSAKATVVASPTQTTNIAAQTNPAPVASPAPALNPPANNPAEIDQVTNADLVAISNTRIKMAGNHVILNFDITNRRREKADGYIWAVATLQDDEGRPSYFGAPFHAKIDISTGLIKANNTGYRFSIQRFKQKTFDFQIPSDQQGDIHEVAIHFADLTGQRTSKVVVPLPAPTPAVPAVEPKTEKASH